MIRMVWKIENDCNNSGVITKLPQTIAISLSSDE